MSGKKIVHIVRHAQGFHQLPLDNPNTMLRDPDLTPGGIKACHDFALKFPFHERIQLLCASPLRRALQTTMYAFEPVTQRGMKITALPDAQEGTNAPSDTGSPVEVLAAEFGDKVDLVNVHGPWYVKEGRYAFDMKSLHTRAESLREWLYERKEGEIALVTHGYFAHYLTGNIDAQGNQLGPWWLNLACRSYYVEKKADGSVGLEETAESVQRMEASNAEKDPAETNPANHPYSTDGTRHLKQ